MESPESPPLTAALAQRVGAGADAVEIAEMVVSTCQALEAVLTPVIGQRGFAALYRRSLHLAAARQPWLECSGAGIVPAAMDLAALKSTLTGQPRHDAAAGGGALLEAFDGLLASLIGRSLTQRLVSPVWENSFNGSRGQDTSQ